MITHCHLSQIIAYQAKKYGNREALLYRNDSLAKWLPISWNNFNEKINLVAQAFLALGVQRQENIGVFSQNMPEIYFTDFGAYNVRAVSIPLYATSSLAQVQYIVNDAQIRYLFVGEQQQYDIARQALSLCQSLTKIIIFDTQVKKASNDIQSIYFNQFLNLGKQVPIQSLEERKQEACEEDLANILYTSGTTGESKGVMITYKMYHSALKGHKGILPITEKDIFINFLPLSHIFERGWSYVGLATGVTIAVNQRPQDILNSLREVRPTCMSAVPRFWEKVYHGVLDKISESSTAKRLLLIKALKTRENYVLNYKCKGLEAPLSLKLKCKFYENTVIRLLKTTLGLDRGNIFPTAGATISPVVERFVHAANINMVAGYGLTESTATVSCDHTIGNKPFTIGSVGRILPTVSVKISEEGEVLLKGGTITPGYYKKEDATKQAFTEDGWFKTGDAGYMKDGELYLTDRIKDLFKTSNGKYIAPQLLETKLSVDHYIDQTVIIANEKRFVSALIVPNYSLLEKYAQEKGLAYHSMQELCNLPQIKALIQKRIETLQQDCASYEKIKAFALLPKPFSMDKGELTNTLKVKRAVINRNYALLIDSLYNISQP